jgi:hypothetical protein
MKPQRIQRKRTKGWKMPAGAVYVGRPTKWGNPFSVRGDAAPLAAVASGGKGNDPHYRAKGVVNLYFRWLSGRPVECGLTAMMAQKEFREAGSPDPPTISDIQAELRGKDLACFCPLDKPCHADVLLDLANAPEK